MEQTMLDLTKKYRKWSTANIRVRLRNDRRVLKWWKTKSCNSRGKADAIPLYSIHINAMESIISERRKRKAA